MSGRRRRRRFTVALCLLSSLAGGPALAKCLPRADAVPNCRYPKGDKWCTEHGQGYRYAYHTICLMESGRANYLIEFWHAGTRWTPAGTCAAVFAFDSGLERVNDLEVTVSVRNESGHELTSGVLVIPRFGHTAAARYAEAVLEGPGLCGKRLMVVVKQARAVVNDTPTDLLKARGLIARDFRPFRVRF